MNNGHIFMPYLQVVLLAAISKTENKIDLSLSRKKLFKYVNDCTYKRMFTLKWVTGNSGNGTK